MLILALQRRTEQEAADGPSMAAETREEDARKSPPWLRRRGESLELNRYEVRWSLAQVLHVMFSTRQPRCSACSKVDVRRLRSYPVLRISEIYFVLQTDWPHSNEESVVAIVRLFERLT